jgi:hypothetical protein
VDGRLVGRETWTTYPGRLGSQRASQPSAVTGVSGKPFPDRAPWFDASFQQNVLRPVSTFLRSLASGMPCDGIGGRPELEGELAALPALAAQRPYVIRSLASGDLVLSVRQGALVLDPRRPDDPSQTWYAVTGTAKAKGAAVSLVNAQTLTVAGVSPRGGRGAKVTLWHRSINDGSTQWVMARDRSGKCTIRLARSPDLGLHAPDGRGDTVIIHSDAKGSARERTWRLEELP